MNVVYNSARNSATVEVRATAKYNSTTLKYSFDGNVQASNIKTFTTSQTTPLEVEVLGSDGSQLEMDRVDFSWNAPTVSHQTGDYRKGQKVRVSLGFLNLRGLLWRCLVGLMRRLKLNAKL